MGKLILIQIEKGEAFDEDGVFYEFIENSPDVLGECYFCDKDHFVKTGWKSCSSTELFCENAVEVVSIKDAVEAVVTIRNAISAATPQGSEPRGSKPPSDTVYRCYECKFDFKRGELAFYKDQYYCLDCMPSNPLRSIRG